MLGMLALWILFVWAVYFLVDKFFRSLKVSNFADKYVFITGCDTGFGRELASHLDGLGFHVFAGCLTREGEKSLSEACSSQLVTVSLDVSKDESITAAAQLVQQKLPHNKGLWALVNNAGILGNFGPFELCVKEDFVKVLNVDLLGPAQTTKHFLPLIRKSRGRIVNITSCFGRFPCKGAPYCAAKCGLEAISDIIRREMYSQGIKVSIIEPGGFQTSIGDNLREQMVASLERASPEIRQIYKPEIDRWISTMSLSSQLASPTLTPVIDAYVHAIISKFPRNRYVVGKDARWFFIPLSHLADWMSDWILRRASRLI